MSPRDFRPSEVSSGGVVFRRRPDGVEVCLINDGRHWGLPKGNVEKGETPEDAALREIEEEVGIARQSMRMVSALPASEYVYRRGGRTIFKRVHQFLLEVAQDTELQADGVEISEAVWLPLDVAVQRASFRDTVTALTESQRLLGVASAGAEEGST